MNDTASQFVKLWLRFQPQIRRYVHFMVPHPADAEDILQEAATRLWEKFAEYDSQRPFVSWAIGFLYIEIRMWQKKQTRERLVFSEEMLARIDAHFNKEVSQLELRHLALDDCLQKLPEKERKLLLKCHGEHGSVKKEAELSNTPVRKLYYWIGKIRPELLTCIESKLPEEGM